MCGRQRRGISAADVQRAADDGRRHRSTGAAHHQLHVEPVFLEESLLVRVRARATDVVRDAGDAELEHRLRPRRTRTRRDVPAGSGELKTTAQQLLTVHRAILRSKEDAEVFRGQADVVEVDVPPRDQEALAVAAQAILAPPAESTSSAANRERYSMKLHRTSMSSLVAATMRTFATTCRVREGGSSAQA